ncbi:MAG: hypothetical protein ACR2N3_04765 [Pyrinomonadaceae bacterium]
MNWKEKFDKWFPITHPEAGIDKYGAFIKVNPERVQDFISTEIIEKIIDDIPDIDWGEYNSQLAHLKQQLKNKWL